MLYKLEKQAGNIALALLLIVSLGGLLIDGLHVPHALYYLADALNILLFALAMRRIRAMEKVREFGPMAFLLAGLVVVYAAGIGYNRVPPLLAAWGLRNMARGLLLFVSCAVLLTRQDVERFFRLLRALYWVNFALTVVQYVFFGIRWDELGGALGLTCGVSNSTVMLTGITLAWALAGYVEGKKPLWQAAAYAASFFTIAALAEIKGMLLLAVLIAAGVLAMGKKSARSLIALAMGAAGVVISYVAMQKLYPEVIDIASVGAADAYVNWDHYGRTIFTRTNFAQLGNEFLGGQISRLLFGLGVGACDMSSYFTSDFFAQYGDMFYRQYTTSFALLQSGWLGLVLLLGFFPLAGLTAAHGLSREENRVVLLTAVGTALLALADCFYYSVLVDMGYWLFFVLALPVALWREDAEKAEE